jgi:hypothetical protein
VKAKARVYNQQEKILEVAETYAIVDPRAMMIHLQDAHAANATVMTTVRLVFPTPFAITPRAQALLFHEHLSFHIPW